MRVFLSRATTIGGLGAAAVVLTAAPALAHVTVNPEEAEQGDYAALTFRVPNESESAGTVKVRVDFPKDTPFASAKVKPHPGWRADVQKQRLPEPKRVGDVQVTEAVRSITWTAEKGTKVAPDQFEEFDISVGPLPEKDSISFPATQTYDDGEVVKWTEPMKPGGAEPEHPAPMLALVSASGSGHGGAHGATGTQQSASNEQQQPVAKQSATDDTARAFGGAGLVVGALGLLAGGFAVIAVRRGGAGSSSSASSSASSS